MAFGTPSLSPAASLLAASFGYALFWRAALQVNPKRRFWLSVVWFALVQAVQLNWLTSTVYMGPLILVLYLFLIGGLGIQFGLLTGWIRLPFDGKQIAGLCGFWVLMEWSRLFFLTGFTWNPSGLSLAANSHSIQFAALFGIYGLCFWVMWVNLFAVKAFLEPKCWKRWSLWAAFAAAPYFYGALQQSVVETFLPRSKEVNVALVQTGMRPEQRDQMNFQRQAHIHPLLQWDRILGHMKSIEADQFDLIILPEGAVPGGAKKAKYSLEAVRAVWETHFGPGSEADFPPLAIPYAKEGLEGDWKVSNSFWVQSLANHYHAEVIIGLDDLGKSENYNAAFHFRAGNSPVQRYEKQILIPGGEYIPFSSWKWLVDFFAEKFGINASFQAGHQSKVFSGAIQAGIFICLEETYSHLVREVRRAGADVFVNITNDVWFPKTRLPWHHFDHGRIRAAENGISLLRACNTGVTAAINCFGAPIKIFPVSEESAGVLAVQVPVQSYPTLYTLWGDWPAILASGVFFSFFAFSRLRKKKTLL
ncbi:MAG TPA: apolipoprotein N-acyltransferase [Chlamydiales bacterium]|nr:apolipoprotein N-acyltransferase [Chlamydiales bacterium]